MVDKFEFVDVNVHCVALPPSEKFDVFTGNAVGGRRDSGTFPKGMAGETCRGDAGFEKCLFDSVEKVLLTEWPVGAGEKRVRRRSRVRAEQCPESLDWAKW
jgi:hypothetical protein